MGNTYFPDRSWTSVHYASALCPVHPIHSLSVFRPNLPPPAEGYATGLVIVASGGISTSLPSQVSDLQPQYQQFLDDGKLLVFASVPIARGGSTGNPTSSPVYDPASNQYGDAYLGNGCWVIPSSPLFANPARFHSVKGAAMALQFIVDAGQQGALPIDTTRLFGVGRSFGGIISKFLFWSENLAPLMFPSGTGRDAISTRQLKVIVADVAHSWFPILDLDGLPVYDPDTQPDGVDFKAHWFPKTTSSPALDVPADTMNQVSISTRNFCSPLTAAQATPAVLTANLLLHAYVTGGSVGTAGAPYDITNPNITAGVQTASERKAHAPWGNAADKVLLGSAVYMVANTPTDLTGLEDAVIDINAPGGIAALYASQNAKLNLWLNYTWPPAVPEHVPVETLVIRAIRTELATILNSNGYATDVRGVVTGGQNFSSVPDFPYAMVQNMDVEYSDGVQYPKIQGVMRVGLLLAVKTNADVDLLTDYFIADVLAALENRFITDGFSLTADPGARFFHNMVFVRSERVFEQAGSVSLAGATMEFLVVFAHELLDPYTPA